MIGSVRYACPCCGYKTLPQEPPGTYALCPICNWEDDGAQFEDPDYEGGANFYSLRHEQNRFMSRTPPFGYSRSWGAMSRRKMSNIQTGDHCRNPATLLSSQEVSDDLEKGPSEEKDASDAGGD